MTDTNAQTAAAAPAAAAPAPDSIFTLLAIDSPSFVDRCYQRILGREPDPAGRANYLAAWFAGEPKLCLIARLRFGGEGRVKGRALRGELFALAFYVGWRTPVAGALFRWVVAFLMLPQLQRRAEQAVRAATSNRRETARSSNGDIDQVDLFIQLRKAEMMRELGALRSEVQGAVRDAGGEPRP